MNGLDTAWELLTWITVILFLAAGAFTLGLYILTIYNGRRTTQLPYVDTEYRLILQERLGDIEGVLGHIDRSLAELYRRMSALHVEQQTLRQNWRINEETRGQAFGQLSRRVDAIGENIETLMDLLAPTPNDSESEPVPLWESGTSYPQYATDPAKVVRFDASTVDESRTFVIRDNQPVWEVPNGRSGIRKSRNPEGGPDAPGQRTPNGRSAAETGMAAEHTDQPG